jgi:hypothetical protein
MGLEELNLVEHQTQILYCTVTTFRSVGSLSRLSILSVRDAVATVAQWKYLEFLLKDLSAKSL